MLPDNMVVLERGWLSSNNVILRGPDGAAVVDTGYWSHSDQTMALVIRALAVGQIQPPSRNRLLTKELVIGLLNGSAWGLIVGLFAVALYGNLALGVVMASAVVLNLVIAALAGVVIPLGLHSAGRDPAQGSSVLLTFITDAMGFFLFLGLATIFLL